MKAVRIHAFGGPEVMQYEDVPTPAPGGGQVLVKLAAAGLNFIDVYQRTGLYPNALPYTLGLEGSGTVAAVGTDVSGLKEGDPVAYTGVAGSYADYVLVPADRLVRMPDGPPRMLTPREAARLMGFPDSFSIPVSNTQAYRQFGNAVVVPVVAFLAEAIREQGWIEAATRSRALTLGLV